MGAQQTIAATCSIDGRRVERAGQETGIATRWLVPDLSMALALLTVLIALLLFDIPHSVFRDSDTGWHIRTGEAILSGGGLPRTDPYSLLKKGQPWFAWEWLSDVLTAAAHQFAGLAGVAMLYLAAIAVCTWMWIRMHWAAGGNFLFACATATLMISTANLHWLARPHVFSWILVLGALLFLERTSLRLNSVTGAGIAVFGALWANMHASFLLGPGIAFIYAASSFARPLIWDLNRAEEWRRSRLFASIAALSLAGTFLNPYGWNLHRHVFAYLGDSELLDHIGEFQSFNFHVGGAGQILLCVGIAVFGGVLALGQKKLAHFLLAVFFVGVALRSARGLPLVALVLLPIANGALTEGLRTARQLRPEIRNIINAFLDYSGGLRAIDRKLGGIALAPVVIVLLFAWSRTAAAQNNSGFPADEFPVRAASEIAKLPSGARLLAPDKFGGYLIYRFGEARPVYFDGRSDFYGSAYMKAYLNLVELRPGWREQVERIGFTHALLPNSYSLIPALEAAGWHKLYSDNVATLLGNK